MNAALVIEDLAGGYGALQVFRDVSISVARGQTIGLYGANGSGKTTLVRTVMGLLPAMKGSVSLDGRSLTGLPAYMRVRGGLAMVPEGRQILGSLTVDDNLRLVRAAWPRARRAEFEEQLAGVFALFPRLQERANQLGGSLSGGEQQMLAIGRAVLVQPSLLILDEPTQGLAPVVVKDLGRVLNSLKQRFSMIVVEQNREFLDGLVDIQFEMKAGTCQPVSV